MKKNPMHLYRALLIDKSLYFLVAIEPEKRLRTKWPVWSCLNFNFTMVLIKKVQRTHQLDIDKEIKKEKVLMAGGWPLIDT